MILPCQYGLIKNLSLAKVDKAEVKALYKDVDRIYISDTAE
jgi:hypothetical protein